MARVTRREFLWSSAAATALIAGSSRARASRQHRPRARAQNLIFMVADGMSTGTLSLADRVRTLRTGKPSHWAGLWEREGVRRAMMATRSADSEVTDSAAAGSAWGIGERVANGAICVTPDGRSPEPILARARDAGLATGLVTTTRVTHATPASFIANAPERGMEDRIARQILERGVDVVLGGGGRHFPDELLARHPDLHLVRTAGELERAGAPSGRLLGLFNESHMRYELDRPPREPTLAAMTRTALLALDGRERGFVVQIEGGRVDHAAHANDAGALLADQLAFDDAIAEVVRFTEGRDDTLVVITTDHGNANPGLTLYAEAGNEGLTLAAGARRSFEWIDEQRERMKRGDTAPRSTAALLEQASGVTLTEAQRDAVERGIERGERVDPFDPANRPGPIMGSVLANHFAIAFLSPNHTSDHVEVTAFGPASESLRGLIDNTALHALAVEALRIPSA